MAITTKNLYLARVLENLILSQENEVNYLPQEVTLDPKQIDNNEDLETLASFLKEKNRKRIFIFKMEGREEESMYLNQLALRSFLNQTAQTLLQNSNTKPKVNPLKVDLHSPEPPVRTKIQIQKSFKIEKHSVKSNKERKNTIELMDSSEEEAVLIPIKDELNHLPMLKSQLNCLGISKIHDLALAKIKQYPEAFIDGIIPKNLHKGFYIDQKKKAICYTDRPNKLPSALAPELNSFRGYNLPTPEQIKALEPNLSDECIVNLLDPDLNQQKSALFTAMPSAVEAMTKLSQTLPAEDMDVMIPLLVKLFVLGGEAHSKLFLDLITKLQAKNVSLAFLRSPEAQDAFLNPRGIKNLQKLIQLPLEQREWWSKLTIAHCKNSNGHFDFNHFFEAYSQIFLAQLAELNLTLPQPCPIDHEGHFLINLNRILDVLTQSENPKEQCQNLKDLDWGPTGVHYAMTQAPENQRLKQVSAGMELKTTEDIKVDLKFLQQQLYSENFNLKPWLLRIMGQNWQKEIRLSVIQEQIATIDALNWSPLEKNQLAFILSLSFTKEEQLKAKDWQESLNHCIELLQSLEPAPRQALLTELSASFNFKPQPKLEQIGELIELCIGLKNNAFPNIDFAQGIVKPLRLCLENEGFELIKTLQARVQKIDQSATADQTFLASLHSFLLMLEPNRNQLDLNSIKLLASINDPLLTQDRIDIMKKLSSQLNTKDPVLAEVLFSILSDINIPKSKSLPNFKNIADLLQEFIENKYPIPDDIKNKEKLENWLKNQCEKILPNCTFGKGDFSKLDDLILDALIETVKKREKILDIRKITDALEEVMKYTPKSLQQRIENEFYPLLRDLDALKFILIRTDPKPLFSDVISTLKSFESKKLALFNSSYEIPIFGSSKGHYIVSLLLTGKKKEEDKLTGWALEGALGQAHNQIKESINEYFASKDNVLKDLNPEIIFRWFVEFNETLSPIFLFKEELVEKKVLPILKRTLIQLDTQDETFEKNILDAAAKMDEGKPSYEVIEEYKNKIGSIASYLNVLIDLKEKSPGHFNIIYKKLNSPDLAQLSCAQKQELLTALTQAKLNSEETLNYLELTAAILKENLHANEAAMTRAIKGMASVFKVENLGPQTQRQFFSMSLNHNLNNPSPFPIETLNELKQSKIPDETKTLITNQLIHILSRMTAHDSPNSLQPLVNAIKSFLEKNQGSDSLCINLLKRVQFSDLSKDLMSYSTLLNALNNQPLETRNKSIQILNCIAGNKKDGSANLPNLDKITRNLARHPDDLGTILNLLITPPYPIAEDLAQSLIPDGSEKIQAYCKNFDLNPFAKPGEKRDLEKQFSPDRIKYALQNLKDLIGGTNLPHSLQLKLARQLSYIDTLGYVDPTNSNDFSKLNKLTAESRIELKNKASGLFKELRQKNLPAKQKELLELQLLALIREIYFRTTGLFPNSTQMLVLLLALHSPDSNLLMGIKTGEGKSLITPMLSVLQWSRGGTVDTATANQTLLHRDYEKNYEPFFSFLGIRSTVIEADTPPEEYQLSGINCSTFEDIALFRLAAKEAKKEHFINDGNPIHFIIDECDDALLDKITLFQLVEDIGEIKNNPEQWVYPMTREFIRNTDPFRNIDPSQGQVWDPDEDLEQFRIHLIKVINERHQGEAEKLDFILRSSNTQLSQWLNASLIALKYVEKKQFIVRPIKEKNSLGMELTTKLVAVPLKKSTPKPGISPDGVQQALQARLKEENPTQAHLFTIDANPPVLASQSPQGLVQFYQSTGGRILGVSGTLTDDELELRYLETVLGMQAIEFAPHAGNNRVKHPPLFTFTKEESIQAIHNAIDSIKKPLTKISIEFESDMVFQNAEDKAQFMDEARKQWAETQTQPILLACEDFDEAEKISQCLESYKKAKFTIQVVTGKETPEELDRIIKQAGKENTITIGTAMLSRGIDIHTNHPEGLFVIQTFPDSKRLSNQIAGRAARNGKKGHWLPIYQISAPSFKNIFQEILYFLIPSFRQKENKKAIKALRREIKEEANVERLYNQAIDETQQSLMQLVAAWESLLLEIYPKDSKLSYDLYQWREQLYSQLAQVQDTNISKRTLAESIANFQKASYRIWETAVEEKWSKKIDLAALSEEQKLRFNYLKQIDLAQEIQIQKALNAKGQKFDSAAEAIAQQDLELMINDKAGAVLHYQKIEGGQQKILGASQIKQLLPSLIGNLCSLYPKAIDKLSEEQDKLKLALNKFVRTINVFDQDPSEKITKQFRETLKDADEGNLELVMYKIRTLIIEYVQLGKADPIELYSMQGLILNFSELFKNAGLEDDKNELNCLRQLFDKEVMLILAIHLTQEFAWAIEQPEPLHAYLERNIAKEAAIKIHELAKNLSVNPTDPVQIQALYTALQEEQLNLQDAYLFSIQHRNPFDVIKKALVAIEALHIAPHCPPAFKKRCQETQLLKHHLAQFEFCLTQVKPREPDELWNYLEKKLRALMSPDQNGAHQITELYETIKRFNGYARCLPYKGKLDLLQAQLAESMGLLMSSDSIKKTIEDSLFKKKTAEIAEILQVQPEEVRIQTSCDGLQSYIEVQVEKSAPIKEFMGYNSKYGEKLQAEANRIAKKMEDLNEIRDELIELKNSKQLETLPNAIKEEFEKLFELKGARDKTHTRQVNLPLELTKSYNKVRALEEWKWEYKKVDSTQACNFFNPTQDFIQLMNLHSGLCEKLIKNLDEQAKLSEEISKLKKEEAKPINQKLNNLINDLSFTAFSKIITEGSAVEEEKLLQLQDREKQIKIQLNALITKLNEEKQKSLTLRTNEFNNQLDQYLIERPKKLYLNYENELKAIETRINGLKGMEEKKSRYQTRRFFNTGEFLNYQANLLENEEVQIPLQKKQPELIDQFWNFFAQKSSQNPMESNKNLELVM